MSDKKLLLYTPAAEFETGYPIGCGNIGAMLCCDPVKETVWLTHESIWSGSKLNTEDERFREKIDALRELYKQGKICELDDTATQIMGDSFQRIRSLEYAGILSIEMSKGEISGYQRTLSLNNGLLSARWFKNNALVTQTAFASFSYETVAIQYRFQLPEDITVGFIRENTAEPEYKNNIFTVCGKTQQGEHEFAVGVKLDTDADVLFQNGKLTLKKAKTLTLYISVTTQFDFNGDYKKTLLEILSEADDFEEIKQNHIEDFSSLFNRSDITFETPEELTGLSVKERLEKLKAPGAKPDYALLDLYFAFGKYLMISSSREGTLPANLQGVWVEKLENPWNADYHTNINLQMNYWLCEVANLSDCHLPLFEYMNRFIMPSGERTAKVNYGCRGLVEHHLSDIYGYTAPADGLWGLWPMGGAWLSTHMWEHYLYTLDEAFLRDTAYQFIKDCALFFIDYLFEDENGRLISGPSMSPENRYYVTDETGEQKAAYLSFSPTMDVEIITAVLRNYIDTENVLKLDEKTKQEAENTLKKLPPLKIGKKGQLMEWLEDYEEPEPGHRHISHAFALYPDHMINENTPELMNAINKTFELRLQNGGGHTGWSRAWLINLFARLKNGEKAYENLFLLLTKSTKESLLDIHPPFQIDGNFGGAAGVAETLLQSHEGYISLLPAVKKDLSGSFTGLKARGDITVGAEFTNGRVSSFTLSAKNNKKISVKLPGAKTVTGANTSVLCENGRFTVTADEKENRFTVEY